MKVFNKKQNSEIGFGSKTSTHRKRLINKDGSFNIERVEQTKWKSISVYHRLLRISWLRFNIGILIYFLVTNAFFATIYLFFGVDGFSGIQGNSATDVFLETFFFSTQTLTTVGFGRISPLSHTISFIAAFESMIGVLGFALVTSLLYGRFSLPTANILFSKNAIIAPFKDIKAFQFRIVNGVNNSQINDLECRVIVSLFVEENGEKIRRFLPVELEVKKIIFFPLTWTINHVIDETSPLLGFTENDFKQQDVECMISLSGFDDTFSQTVTKRYSYTWDEIIYWARFISVYTSTKDGQMAQDLTKLSDYERIAFED